MVEKRLDVVICTYTQERLDDLLAAVESVRTQDFPSGRTIVVVDHNPDLAGQLRPLLNGVTVVENTHSRGLSGGRNTGIECGTAPVVAFLDDDARAMPGWLERIWSHYDDPMVLAVGGAALPDWEVPAPPWFPEEFGWVVGCSYRGQPETVSEVRNLLGSNMSLRREVFDRVGGFSDTVGRVGKNPTGCEETELCIRAVQGIYGGKVIYDPEISVNHTVGAERATIRYFLRRCWFEGRSKAYVSSLVGAAAGISQERSYALNTLTRGVVRCMGQMLFKGDLYAGARAAIIVIGFSTTAAGYLTGRSARFFPGSTGVLHGRDWTARRGDMEEEGSRAIAGGSDLQLVQKPLPDGVKLPRASVVVPSLFARPEQLKACLDSLVALDYPDYEIIVVDNRRSDGELDSQWPSYHHKVRILRERFPGISAARNSGVNGATGEIVAFTDDDVEVDASWLRSLVLRLLSDERIACVTGLVLPGRLETPAQRWFEEYLGGFNRGPDLKVFCPSSSRDGREKDSVIADGVFCATKDSVESLSLYQAAVRCGAGASMAFRREALGHVGGFNLALGTGTPSRGGEDLAVFAAIFLAGWCIAYEPQAVVHHTHRRTYAELVSQVSGSGIGLTAMLTSLVMEDPRHVVHIINKVPLAITRIIKLRFAVGDPLEVASPRTYPPSLRWHEMSGMFKGPAAYLRSRRSLAARSPGMNVPASSGLRGSGK